ncbi:hypothetical protein HMPREF1861_00753 [Corynebacterium kroppenstedtii]|nr:hypothetical protein HMPREF1861_00753 [Corynebacterium kroppenstedtii]
MHAFAGNVGFRASHVVDTEKCLPLKVSKVNDVIIADGDMPIRADARRCQRVQQRRPQSTCADHAHARGGEALLDGFIEECQMTCGTDAFIMRERRESFVGN